MLSSIINLWTKLSKKRHTQFFALILLMVFTSILEVLSIGAVVPFLSILSSPDSFTNLEVYNLIKRFVFVSSPDELIFPITITFISTILIAGIFRILLLFSTTRYAYSVGADISVKVFTKSLYQDYEKHLSQNSSEIINAATNKVGQVINGVLSPLMIFISSLFISIFSAMALFFIDYKLTIYTFFVFLLIYLSIILISKKYLMKNSLCIARESTNLVKIIQEGLGGIRDIIINGNQSFYSSLYKKSDLPMRRALGNNAIINGTPRFAIEALGVSFITIISYFLSLDEKGFVHIVPTLGAVAIAAQKILPAIQQLYGAFVTIRGSEQSLIDVLEIINFNPRTYNDSSTLDFNKSIKLSNINFSYEKNTVLDCISVDIKNGSKVGFIGETGSGKSTFLDIVMGLLKPTNGEFFIDNKKVDDSNRNQWRKHISHVPQNIYLIDGTVAQNIAFGIEDKKIDMNLVNEVAKISQLESFIKDLPNGYNTVLGERGSKISGGQRQRIGIARALYKKSSVLVLDEATSALDSKTEERVMDAIFRFAENKTILIISHKLTTLSKCDKIFVLKNKKLTTYDS